MLDKFTYENHLGEKIDFGSGNIIIDSNELRNYEWTYNNYYNRASGFKKKMRSVPLTVLVYGDDANATADRIYETVEKDVLDGKRGKITINGYYTYGYFYSSQKVSYLKNGILKMLFYIVIDGKHWIKETYFQFRPTGSTSGEWLTYPHGFTYTFKRERRSVDSIYNDSFVPQNMRITIYGACTNPTVVIAGHQYQLNTILTAEERAVIDTAEKTITKYSSDGAETNIFSTRGLNSYIFTKIPVGVQTIQTLPNNVNADVIVLEERSEPKWAVKEKLKEKDIKPQKEEARTTSVDWADAYIDNYGHLIFTNNDNSSLDLAINNEHLILSAG